jgi:hypothetical protein
MKVLFAPVFNSDSWKPLKQIEEMENMLKAIEKDLTTPISTSLAFPLESFDHAPSLQRGSSGASESAGGGYISEGAGGSG